MGSREEFLSCGRWAVRGSLILEQCAIPSPGVPSLLSEYASTPERGCSTGREIFFFSFVSHFKPDSICGTDQKKMVSMFRYISQCEYEVHVLEHEDGVKKI